MKARPVIAATLFVLCGATSAEGVEVAIQVEPGVGIPLGAFPSGVPLSVDDVDGTLLGGPPNSAVNLLLDLKPTAAFNFSTSLMLNNFTLRAAFSIQKFASVRVADVAIAKYDGQTLPDPIPNLYLKNLLGLKGYPTDSIDFPDGPTITTVRFTLGYRFYLREGRFRPYVPLGVGPAFMFVDGEANYGVDVHLGAGAEYRLTHRLDLGLLVQYEWTGIMLPENFQPAAARNAITAQVSSSSSALGAFLKSMHTLQIAVTTTMRF